VPRLSLSVFAVQRFDRKAASASQAHKHGIMHGGGWLALHHACTVVNCMGAALEKDYTFEPKVMGRAKTAATWEPAFELLVVCRSSDECVPDAFWSPAKFYRRAAVMYDMYLTSNGGQKDSESMMELYPPEKDPYYDPPTQTLVGVGYCHLSSLNYMIDVHESVPVINFKGCEQRSHTG